VAPDEFESNFTILTGNRPFPWQESLFHEFTKGNFPSSCNLPTGLGKTSVIPIWLLALSTPNSGSVPRRLVYVVNRRTVVDQATEEAKKVRERLAKLPAIANQLHERCVDRAGPSLAISTLRGQFADNREWSIDPARPAVVVGTVDVIGSRLLFEGYGCGFKTRPLHAGFLGQDVLVVHDEAHLEPAFQRLLEAIRDEQHDCERTGTLPWPKLRVMALTATPRGDEKPFELTEAERNPPADVPDPPALPIHHVWRRLKARKGISFILTSRAELPATIADRALRHKEQGKAILVFVRTIDDVNAVRSALIRKGIGVTEEQVVVLTGTLRGLERDRLATHDPVFARFLADPKVALTDDQKQRTVYLVCTSAGEVGVDISADHMVSDLTPLDSMAQRFGRVNRRGGGKAEIDVVYESEPDPKRKDDALERARWTTLSHLQSLPACDWIADRVEASPREIGQLVRGLTDEQRATAFTPSPDILLVSDILFDAWAMTTLRGRLPGRPPVEDWLHGVSDRDPPETHVAWREEVKLLSPVDEADRERREDEVATLLDEFPLKPHELLRDRTSRVHETLAVLAEGREAMSAWVIASDDTVRITTLGELVERDKKGFVVPLGGCTVLLPPTAGGLTTAGTFDGSAAFVMRPREEYDVAGYVPVREPTDGTEPSTGITFLRLLRSVRHDASIAFRVVGWPFGLPRQFVYDPAQEERTERELLDATFAEAALPRMKFATEIVLRDEGDESDVRGVLATNEEDESGDGAETGGLATFRVFKRVGDRRKPSAPPAWPALERHLHNVRNFAQAICERLGLPSDLVKAVAFAAACHDLGKDRGVWQRGAGNRDERKSRAKPVAKTLHGRPPENLNGFRHEFASLIDVQSYPELLAEFETFSLDMQDVILHLIATHHGRGRPHFPGRGDADLRPRQSTKKPRRRTLQPENIDPERPEAASVAVAIEIPSRFSRLQQKYGRWGLAYLESLVRAADALDSRQIEETPIGNREAGIWPRKPPSTPPHAWRPRGARPEAAIRVRMEPTNPGQFFACCGLLELAHRLWNGAEGWFDGSEFCLRPAGNHAEVTPKGLIDELARCRVMNVMTEEQLTLLDQLSQLKGRDRSESQEAQKKELESIRRESPIRFHFSGKFDLRIDWFLDGRSDGSRFKTWAGQQSVIDIAQGMHGPLLPAKWCDAPPAEWLSRSVSVDALPFYFDSGLSGQGAALDAGFSFDPLGFKMPSRPLLELAAFIGLQRFRPLPVPGDNLYRFDLWPSPLLPATAAVAACGAVAMRGAQRYEFRLLYRTKYLKSFLPAQPYRGDAR
jgi:CRISPR-associated endonuclease/helicase Cas3